MDREEKEYAPWIDGLVVVTFDLDEGQKVHVSVPGPLNVKQQKQISMLAFPDSNSCSQYEGIFKYIFKTVAGQYAFVCFKQKKDANNRRGYAQKSFVILTALPFLIFFQKLAEFLVFKLFGCSDQQLETELGKLKQQAEKWPEPQPLTNYILPVLDYEIAIEIPNYIYDFNGKGFLKVQNFPNNKKDKKTATLEQIVTQQTLLQFGRFQQVKLTQHFGVAFQQLWVLWQNVMLNHPILLMADNPYKASQTVLAALSLLNPLQYGGQFYPYVTVYDSHLNDLQQAERDVIFGATNPLFLKLFTGKKIKIIEIGKHGHPKHLRPLKQLFVKSHLQEQRMVNESALRKYFYKLNCNIITILQQYVDLQTNDLKFFNEKQFLRFVRKREGEDCLSQVFDSRRHYLAFWQNFVQSLNFAMLLRSRNIVRERV